jgi:hypothetical protein
LRDRTIKGVIDASKCYKKLIKFPQVLDIKEDVKESYEIWSNEGYIHAWLMQPVIKILVGLQGSMKKFPLIKPGQDFRAYK